MRSRCLLNVYQRNPSHNLLAFHMCSALHSLADNSEAYCSYSESEVGTLLNALIDAVKQMPQLTSLK